MALIEKELLFENSHVSLLNTRQERYNNVKFSAELEDGCYVLKNEQGTLPINIKDEIILYIIMKFRFCPSWLAKQWYEDDSNFTIDGNFSSKLKKFVDFGLIYEFPSAVSVFLMPTERLASLFNTSLGAFNNPPYNTLTHTISEEQVMYECMMGEASYLKDCPHIPFVSNLGLGKNDSGCYTIPESDYSVKLKYFKDNIMAFNDQEAKLAKEMLDGKIITTPDLKESKLVIHKKVDISNYEIKVPDLAVLAPRKLVDGVAMPQSIAIEVELTCKSIRAYEKILDIYWSNLKYGRVIYLINSTKTKNCLLEAINRLYKKYDNNTENKTCEFQISEFVVPYNKEQLLFS